MRFFSCLSYLGFGTPQAKVSDISREKVLVMFGDSNFYYSPRMTFLSRLLGNLWLHESVGEMVRAQLRGRVILASTPCLNYRDSTMKQLQTSLETLLALHPNADVHVLVLVGQNDADAASRESTSVSAERIDQFRQFIKDKAQKLEDDLMQFREATIHWVIPFDDPKAEWTPLYVQLVEELKRMISLRQSVVSEFGPFSSFEVDQYHLVTEERTKFANQVLKWFANL